MGLDITYYSNLKPLDCTVDKEGDPVGADGEPLDYNTWFRPYINPDFPERAADLPEKFYTFDASDDFRAGSYSGYSEWRDELAKLAGYPKKDHTFLGKVRKCHSAGAWETDSGPFWELIQFSDCEGSMGPAVCAKLAKDFAEFEERAMQHPDNYWRERYQNWKKAFEVASNNGAVSFH